MGGIPGGLAIAAPGDGGPPIEGGGPNGEVDGGPPTG